MKMKLDGVLAGATPGPWEIGECCKILAPTWLVRPTDDDPGIRVCVIDCTGAMGGDRSDLDMALMVHCRNHLPKLVAMLHHHLNGSQGYDPYFIIELAKALQAAQEVEVTSADG